MELMNAPSSRTIQNAVLQGLHSRSNSETRRMVQQQLILILHARRCQKKENQANGKVVSCSVRGCRAMRHLLHHMATCRAGKYCTIPHCATSRQIITHFRNCSRSTCPICLPLHQASHRRQPLASGGQQSPIGPSSLNHIGSDLAQLHRPQMPPRPIGTGAPTGGSQQEDVLLNADKLSISELVTKLEGLALLPSELKEAAPGAERAASQNLVDWRTTITDDVRTQVMQRIAHAIYPTTVAALQDRKLANLVALARRDENNLYMKANSAEEYFQLLNKKVQEIEKLMEQFRKWKESIVWVRTDSSSDMQT